jgi:hypothetical protein
MSLLLFLVLMCLFVALVTSCIVLYIYVREQARTMMCGRNLKQIGLALRSYHLWTGAFPPAYLCDETGKPVNSWRTLIARYYLYSVPTYDFAKPWNGPENSRLLLPREKATLQECQCPSAGNQQPAITNYVAVVGPNTMWPGREAAKQAADGSDREKILVIEVINSNILWMEPRDLTLEQALDAIQPKTGIGIGSHHRDGIHYVTVAGAVRTLDPNIDRESLRKLLVRSPPAAAPETGKKPGRSSADEKAPRKSSP